MRYTYRVKPCIVCGRDFRGVQEKRKSKRARYFNATDIGKYIKTPWRYGSFCRSIYLCPTSKKCRLSGIIQVNWDISPDFRVPRDRHTGFLGQPYPGQKGMIKVRGSFEGKPLENERDCYLLHASCWSLTERIIGSDAEQHLDILSECFHTRQISHLCYSGATSYNTDPLYIPQIYKIIERSNFQARRSRRIRETSTPKYDCALLRLPLEIKYIILDLLRWVDVFKVKQTIGLQVGDQYWRKRINKTILFEIQDVSDDKDIDWESLFHLSKGWLKPKKLLANRVRAMGFLEMVKSDLQEKLR